MTFARDRNARDRNAHDRNARDRTVGHAISSLPKMGFLLLILALAINGLPKLRSLQVGFQGSTRVNGGLTDSDADGINSISVVEDSSPNQLDQVAQTPDSAPTSAETPIQEPNQEDVAKIGSEQDAEEGVSLDGQTQDLLSVVADNTLRMSKREMPAYWELVRKTSKLSFEKLRESGKAKVKFNELYGNPSKHRGELIALDVVVRRVNRYETEPDNKAGVNGVYEIWASTDQSHAWLYVFITDSLPDGFNEETILKKRIQFAGYFLKLMAYQPGNAAPNAKPLLAPLLIGRLNSPQKAIPIEAIDPPWWASWWLSSFLVVTAVFLTLRVFLSASQPRRRTEVPENLGKDFNALWDELNSDAPSTSTTRS